MIKKALSFALCLFMAVPQTSVFAVEKEEYFEGKEEFKSTSYGISPGLTYTEKISKNEKYGYERSYVYEYTPGSGTDILVSSGKYLYGTNSLGMLTEQLEAEGIRVVGGVNGDFYSMTTGVPIGAMISDGEIISSDNERMAMGFDKDGNAFISHPKIVTTLKNSENEINIEHINKYPLEYALYLITDRFHETTKSTKASSEIILMPYDSVTYITDEEYKTDEGSKNFLFLKEWENEAVCDDAPEDSGINEDSESTDNNKESGNAESASLITEQQSEENDSASENEVSYEALKSDNPRETEKESVTYDVSENGVTDVVSENAETDETVSPEESSETEKQDETKENESGGETKTYEESEAKETDESEKSEESEEINVPEEYYAREYGFSGERLKIGSDMKVVVTEIRRDSTDTKIPEGCFVICAENEYQYDRIKNLSVGDELTLAVTADEKWYDAVSAVGDSGGLIVKDGEYFTDVEIDHYVYANPRTAAGITADGKVIFYCVDGRGSKSGGLRIDQLAYEMIELGCVTAINLDGGGSTTAYAALPGMETSELRNSPSDKWERRTANSVIFVNNTEKTGEEPIYHIYPQNAFVHTGENRYEIGKLYATDKNYHPISLPDDIEYKYFLEKGSDHFIEDGRIFVSGTKEESVDIYVRVTVDGEITEHLAGSIFVIDGVESFALPEKEYTISPFDSFSVTPELSHHTIDVSWSPDSVLWNISGMVNEENIGETDLSELIYLDTRANGFVESEKGIMTIEGEFTPKTEGESFYITARAGSNIVPLKVNVLAFPFNDSFTHWAAENIYNIHSFGLMNGEPDGEEGEMAFRPSRNLTRAEFFTILARMLYPDIDKKDENTENPDINEITESAENTENTKNEDTVIVWESAENEVSEAADEPTDITVSDAAAEKTDHSEDGAEITASETEEIFEEKTEYADSVEYLDSAEIPEWAKKYFDALSESGLTELIAETREDGGKYIKPDELITRLEVMIIIGALCEEETVDFITTFVDSAELAEHENAAFVNNAISAGIITGYEDGTLRAANHLTRAEAATVILRYYDNSDFAQ